MANAEHLAVLWQGVEIWNEWRENNNNCEILIDLIGANLTGLNLTQVNLNRANLSGADLSGVNLSHANLRMANLGEANLTGADLTGADLKMANLRMAILSRAKLSGADLKGAYLSLANLNEANLSEAKLSGVNLRMAYLGGTNLTGTNLSEANLSGAILERAEALETNFNKAILTGACLQDWTINNATNLYNVICDYVYLKPNQQERRPSSGNFATGEFFMLFRKAPDPVEAIVYDEANTVEVYQIGVGGNVQNYTSQPTTVETKVPDQVQTVQIDVRGDDLQNYTSQPTIIEARVPEQVNTVQVNLVGDDLQNYTSQPTTVQAEIPQPVKTVQVNPIGTNLHSSSSQQHLAEVATEIKQHLQLGQIYPTSTPTEKLIVVLEAIRRIESNPTLKVRVVKALREADPEVWKKLIDNPLSSIFLAAVEDWRSKEV